MAISHLLVLHGLLRYGLLAILYILAVFFSIFGGIGMQFSVGDMHFSIKKTLIAAGNQPARPNFELLANRPSLPQMLMPAENVLKRL